MLRSSITFCLLLAALPLATGCEAPPPPYGVESGLYLEAQEEQVWAVAPVINITGQPEVDPILQADLLYQQLQQVHGINVIPVDRVVQVYAGLHIDKVESAEQAALVCDLLGCDALVVATITAYDPYDPPKVGGSVQVFPKPQSYARPDNVSPRELSRAASPLIDASLPTSTSGGLVQAVGMYDAANGSVRAAVLNYAHGRHNPAGPLGPREYFLSMDRYCGFAYNALLADVLRAIRENQRPRT